MMDNIENLPFRKGVGIVLINKERQIWVGQRLDRPKDQAPAWQMPQGGIDPGEDPQTAALRELQEETSVTHDKVKIIDQTPDWVRYYIPPELIQNLWSGKYQGQEQMWYLMSFEGHDKDISIDTEHPEFSSWKWSSAETVVDQIVPFKREMYAKILASFSVHLN